MRVQCAEEGPLPLGARLSRRELCALRSRVAEPKAGPPHLDWEALEPPCTGVPLGLPELE